MPEPDQDPPDDIDRLEKFFVFCLMWSLGGCLLEADREIFSEFIRGLSGLILPNNSLYDEYFDIKKLTLSKWDSMVAEYVPPATKKFSEILVPTVDTVRYSWLLEQIMNLKKPACFCGESGTAKTVTVNASFAKLDRDKF
jgi:dynein heavy chain